MTLRTQFSSSFSILLRFHHTHRLYPLTNVLKTSSIQEEEASCSTTFFLCVLHLVIFLLVLFLRHNAILTVTFFQQCIHFIHNTSLLPTFPLFSAFCCARSHVFDIIHRVFSSLSKGGEKFSELGYGLVAFIAIECRWCYRNIFVKMKSKACCSLYFKNI